MVTLISPNNTYIDVCRQCVVAHLMGGFVLPNKEGSYNGL